MQLAHFLIEHNLATLQPVPQARPALRQFQFELALKRSNALRQVRCVSVHGEDQSCCVAIGRMSSAALAGTYALVKRVAIETRQALRQVNNHRLTLIKVGL